MVKTTNKGEVIMNFEISNIRTIEEEYLKDFKFKTVLSEMELYGLEMAIIKLLVDDEYKVDFAYKIVDRNTRHLEDCLDVLDGRGDILYVGGYKVLAVHLTTNNIPVLKCLKDECDYHEDDDSIFYATIG